MRYQYSFFLAAWLTGTFTLAALLPANMNAVAERTTNEPRDLPPQAQTSPSVRCEKNYKIVYHGNDHWGCELDEISPDPSTCPLIKCTSTTHPVYHPEIHSCSCDPIPPVCPNTIYCAAGAEKFLNSTTNECACRVTNPIPGTCPQFKCREYSHVVYNPDTDKCGCTDDCPDVLCISEKRATYNFTTNSCSCEYIKGLERSSIKARAEETHPNTNSISTPPTAYVL